MWGHSAGLAIGLGRCVPITICVGGNDNERNLFIMNIEKFEKKPVMGILRGVGIEHIEPLFNDVCDAGLETIEITMNTPDADKSIKKAVSLFGDRMSIGAGTVVNMEAMKMALDSGASFIVMPTLVEDVVSFCVNNKIPVFPGAFTPQEIINAWNMGASMVKVFPAKFFGPEYFKEIKGPFNNVKLLACGGVKPENIKEFLSSGADGAAIGGSTFKQDLLQKKDYTSISNHISKYLNNI